VKTDNIGAILCPKMLQPAFVLGTPRYHFVREFIEDGFIKIEFVRSFENDSDLFTKNISSCMQNTRRNLWKIVEFTVPVDHYRIGRVLEISFAINNLVLQV
jgi:hypothetical protein